MYLKYNLSEKDWGTFNIYHNQHIQSRNQKIFTKIFFFIIMLLLINQVFIKLGMKHEIGLRLALSCVVDAAVALFAVKPLERLLQSIIFKIYVKSGYAAEFIGEREVRLLDDAIHITTSKGAFEMNYDAILNLLFDKDMAYMYISKLSAILIPYSAFADEMEKQEFFDIIRHKMNFPVHK